jgi:hypothetical protein
MAQICYRSRPISSAILLLSNHHHPLDSPQRTRHKGILPLHIHRCRISRCRDLEPPKQMRYCEMQRRDCKTVLHQYFPPLFANMWMPRLTSSQYTPDCPSRNSASAYLATYTSLHHRSSAPDQMCAGPGKGSGPCFVGICLMLRRSGAR